MIRRTTASPSAPPSNAIAGSCRHSGGSALHALAVDIGRIGHDQVVAAACDRREQVALQQPDAVFHPVIGDIALGDLQRVFRQFDRIHHGVGEPHRRENRKAPGAGAKIENASNPVGIAHQREFLAREQLAGENLAEKRPRHDGALVDGERHAEHVDALEQIGRGLAGADALRDQAADLLLLRGRHRLGGAGRHVVRDECRAFRRR